MIDRGRLGRLLERERATFGQRHPRSRAAYQAAGASLFGGVPMTWMNKAPGGFPVYLVQARGDADLVDTGGVGGTLAGNALSVAAARATLEHVLTPEAFGRMIALASRLAAGVGEVLGSRGLPWSVVQLGARAEVRFTAPPPVNGGQSAVAGDPQLDDYLHLYLHNRGILLTPFHNMALTCPATTQADIDLYTQVLAACLDELAGT